ncbi:MAG: ribosome biogenesis GTP-binding protein YihA/YsxC [Endomicrobium sp.]|uniref:ribosome biogenesis GTP-binding protein YihA/YsxC n=1 Tax=Candidatus Endomicrobiellum pyrsonymphae TaxID=1408203 RepID=UPI003577DBF2|nr:ribosome biogenesis GTP-binding protein YihA/YsxC [Endomicrobium sp.]
MLEKAVFFRGASKADSLPQSVVEIVLSGRSNVGKSSVINALCSQKNLARTSKTPGRTRSINVYSVAMRKWIIDLPGYGFARVSRQEKDLWNKMIEECIIQRKSKKVIYIIVDAFVGPTELDFDMAHWLSDYSVPFKIVANKCDKMPKGITEDEIQIKAAECFGIDKVNVFAVSAKKDNGFGKLRIDIVKFLSCKG